MADILVSGAGTAAANGTYTLRGTYTSRNYYNLVGQADHTIRYSISWNGAYWAIWDFNEAQYYYSTENVTTPDLVATWLVFTGSAPVPTVTIAPNSYVYTPSGGLVFGGVATTQYTVSTTVTTAGANATRAIRKRRAKSKRKSIAIKKIEQSDVDHYELARIRMEAEAETARILAAQKAAEQTLSDSSVVTEPTVEAAGQEVSEPSSQITGDTAVTRLPSLDRLTAQDLGAQAQIAGAQAQALFDQARALADARTRAIQFAQDEALRVQAELQAEAFRRDRNEEEELLLLALL